MSLDLKVSGAIGEKGHGTKIYFNSRSIELRTVRDGNLIGASMADPRQKLQRGEMPAVEFVKDQTTVANGTRIVVRRL